MMNLVNTPGGAAFWEERACVFGAVFRGRVAEIMRRAPDPRAKAFGVAPVTHVASAAAPTVGE